MKTSWTWTVVGLGIISPVVAGCGGEPLERSTEAGGSRVTASALFRDPSTSGPRLDVYDLGGNIAVAVTAPIGEPLLDARPDATLTEMFRALHPDASTVPAELAPLEARIEPFLANQVAEPPPPQPVVVPKSYISFLTKVCVTFVLDSSTSYVPVDCEWTSSANEVWLGEAAGYPKPDWAGSEYFGTWGNNRVYDWNNASELGLLFWFFKNSSNLYVWSLPAYTWSWTIVYSGGPYANEFSAPPTTVGDIGIARHVLETHVR